MAINFGDILGGLGAAYGGRAQEYAQGIQQREQGLTERKRMELEARQRAMYEDANTAFGFLSNPELNYEQRADYIIRLAEDRLDALSNYPDADPSDTLQVLDLANQMREGTDPTAVTKLAKILAPAYQIYKQRYAPQQEQERGVVVDGNVVNPMTGNVIYQGQPQAAAMEEYSPGITRFRNGVAVQYGRQGGVRVVDEQGRVVTGPGAEAAIQRGQASGISEAGQIAAEQVQGRGSSEREQSIINAGIDAASALPTVIDAIGLLEEIKTGGFAGASIRAKSLFGIESGDEGELSNLLSVNVLERLKPIFGAAFTAAEGERLERISASPGRSTDTNIRLLRRELKVTRTALENALDRALDVGDTTTATQIENGLSLLNQFEGGASTMQGGAADMGNPDLLNRADAIVRGSSQ
jgi:hypothetical protein